MDGTTIVTVGIDTHTDVHVAAVLDQMGRLLATASFAATTRGYAQLATWAESFGEVDKVGMEGTGCFGAGLLRFLADYGLAVIEVRGPLRKLTPRQRIRACAALRPGPLHDPGNATKAALRSLARRWQALQAEIDDLDAQLTPLVTAVPQLVALPGIGIDTAGQLLVTAGDNPARLRTERSFARLCGVAPHPASSGRTGRPSPAEPRRRLQRQ